MDTRRHSICTALSGFIATFVAGLLLRLSLSYRPTFVCVFAIIAPAHCVFYLFIDHLYCVHTICINIFDAISNAFRILPPSPAEAYTSSGPSTIRCIAARHNKHKIKTRTHDRGQSAFLQGFLALIEQTWLNHVGRQFVTHKHTPNFHVPINSVPCIRLSSYKHPLIFSFAFGRCRRHFCCRFGIGK